SGTWQPSAYEQAVDQLLDSLAVRRIDEARGIEALLDEHSLGLAEGQETFVAVVVAHAGGADAAERQVILSHMQQRIVDAYAAGVRMAEYVLLLGLVVAEVVERQRAVALVDVGQRLVELVVG